MADIELVIKIPEETYEYWKEHKHEFVLAEATANGTPLPKGHGRLKDVDKLELSCIHSNMECFGDCSRCHDRMVILKDLEDAKTIIEADSNS